MIPESFERLGRHRSKLASAALATMRDPDVVGMAVGGSFAAGFADKYSDVDLWIAVTDETLPVVRDRARAIADDCGDVVAAFTAEHIGDQDHLVVLYDDLIHVDFQYVEISALGGKVHGRPAVVVWEREGAVSRQLPGKALESDVAEDLAWLEERVWTWLWYTQSKLLRGEIYEALSGIGSIREMVLFRLVAIGSGIDPVGSRRIEASLGDHEAAVASTVPTLDRESLATATRALADIYTSLADPLLAKYSVSPNHEARRAVGVALDAGLAWVPPSPDET